MGRIRDEYICNHLITRQRVILKETKFMFRELTRCVPLFCYILLTMTSMIT